MFRLAMKRKKEIWSDFHKERSYRSASHYISEENPNDEKIFVLLLLLFIY